MSETNLFREGAPDGETVTRQDKPPGRLTTDLAEAIAQLDALRREWADWMGEGISDEDLEQPAVLRLVAGGTFALDDCTVAEALARLKRAVPLDTFIEGTERLDLLEVASVSWPEALASEGGDA